MTITGLLEEKDYRLQLNRITAAVTEMVDHDTVGVTLSHPDSKRQRWAGRLGKRYSGLDELCESGLNRNALP